MGGRSCPSAVTSGSEWSSGWPHSVLFTCARTLFETSTERYLADDPFDADRKRKALTAVAAKMARVVYAVIKSGAYCHVEDHCGNQFESAVLNSDRIISGVGAALSARKKSLAFSPLAQ